MVKSSDTARRGQGGRSAMRLAALLLAAWPALAFAEGSGDGAEPAEPGAAPEATARPDAPTRAAPRREELVTPAIGERASRLPAGSAGAGAPAAAAAAASAPKAPPSSPPAPAPTGEPGTFRYEADQARLSITPYGMLITNAVYNTGSGQPSSEAPTVARASSGFDELDSDRHFLISGRQSRLGVRALWETDAGWNAASRIEMDFFGLSETQGPTANPMSAPRLRLASFDIGSPSSRFVFGQDWLIVTPRLPTSIGHSAVALHTLSGAVWNRLPQIGLWFDRDVASLRFRTQLAVVRPHSGDGGVGLGRADEVEPGLSGRLPFGQMRLSLATKDAPLAMEWGVAGHLGRESFEVVTGIDRRPGFRYGEPLTRTDRVLTWMGSTDLRLQWRGFWLQGQAWMGENLNGLFGRQGVYRDTWRDWEELFADAALAGKLQDVRALPAWGGWVELGVPTGVDGLDLIGSVGADVGDEQEVDFQSIHRNLGVYGALQYTPAKWLAFSLEYLHTATWYRPDDSRTLRPGWDIETDPLRGEDPPRRFSEGYNDNFSFNARLTF